MVSPLAEQTIKRVSEKLESGEAAGLSEIVELIQRLSSNAYETSVQELATLIGKDVVVTAKVIAAANTIGYNPIGTEVSTITQAIHVIGFNKIRQLAVSLLLVENANRMLTPHEKREIAAIALCSGLMAESVMTQRGNSSPEHAFICASLRNYGRLLMTSFMIEDYRRARIMATEGVAEDEAFNRVFGLTPLELGHHLLASAHLPDAILKSLRKLSPEALKTASQTPDGELLALADLSVRLCELALRSDITASDFTAKASGLASRQGQIFGLDAMGLIGVLRETGQQLNEFAHTFGLNALTDQFAPRIHARITGNEPDTPMPKRGSSSASPNRASQPTMPPMSPAEASATTPPSSSASSPSASAARPTPVNVPLAKVAPDKNDSKSTAPTNVASPTAPPAAPLQVPGVSPAAAPETKEAEIEVVTSEAKFQRAFQSGIEQLAGLLEEDPVDMRKVYAVILRATLQGFATDNACLFLRDARTRRFAVHYGNGPLNEAIRRSATFRDDERNVFGLCLQRLEDVLITDANDPKILPHMPSWAKHAEAASFVLLPIQENRQVFALVMASWREKKSSGFTVAQIRQVRSMLKLAGTARKLAAHG